jgi:nucleoside-diphosphate-sugar epimerase
MSRILVTGINSPLGQAVGRKLQAEGHVVVGTVRSSKLNTQGLPAHELIALDLENADSFRNITGEIQAIVHVAAASVGSAEDLLSITGFGTLYLVERAKTLNVKRMVHISGMDAYGEISVPTVSESTQPTKQNAYGSAKWTAESYVSDAASFFEGISIRSPAIAGRNHTRHFLARTLKKMLNENAAVVVSNPNFYFNNLVHETVLADFIFALLELRILPELQAVTVGSLEAISFEKVIEFLATISNYKGEIKWVESTAQPFNIDFSTTINFGFKPITLLQTLNLWTKDLHLKEVKNFILK